MRTSYEQAHYTTVTLKKLPVVVNGDDCLTAFTNPQFPKIWEINGKVMGLTKSIGKTYASGAFCCINSQFFVLQAGLWKYVPFINLGILYGQKRSGSGDDKETDPLELGALYAKLQEQAKGLDNEKLTERFIYYNMKTLRTYNGPWNLPIWACGLGIESMRDPSYDDRLRVTALKQMYNKGESVPKKMGNNEWSLHNTIMKEIHKQTDNLVGTYNFNKYTGQEDYGKKYIQMAYGMWSKLGVKGLLAPPQKEGRVVLRHMERLWSKAGVMIKKTNIRPTKAEQIQKEPKATVTPFF